MMYSKSLAQLTQAHILLDPLSAHLGVINQQISSIQLGFSILTLLVFWSLSDTQLWSQTRDSEHENDEAKGDKQSLGLQETKG